MDVFHPVEKSDTDAADSKTDFRAANEAVARLGRQYPELALRDLVTARKTATRLADSADPAAEMEALRVFAHTLKGQGGSFGFELASDMAELLEQYLARIEAPTALQLRTIIVHLDALQVVFKRRIAGDGGELGRTLLARLQRTGSKTAA